MKSTLKFVAFYALALSRTVISSPSKVSCRAELENFPNAVKITCDFHCNVSDTKPNINVRYFRPGAETDPDTLSTCNWLEENEEKKPHCRTQPDCFVTPPVTDTLTLTINRTFEEGGYFQCDLVPAVDITPCFIQKGVSTHAMLVSEASSQINNVSSRTPMENHGDNSFLVSSGSDHYKQSKCVPELWNSLSAALVAVIAALAAGLAFTMFLFFREKKRLKAKYSYSGCIVKSPEGKSLTKQEKV